MQFIFCVYGLRTSNIGLETGCRDIFRGSTGLSYEITMLYNRATQIPGVRSPGRLNFVR